MKKSATKPSKKSTRKRHQIVVLIDSAGNYYEVPRAVLERGKVRGRRKKQVKKALEDEVEESGYINAPVIPGSVVSKPSRRILRYAGFYLRRAEPRR
jgi:hypothetical protein